ncbi:hypothetical protein D7W81_13830 [Corallococcus aberystwythensis]|uniref:Uncharacterized protein n=1 Tax=Corallococcus aberystwythensis TaxID=2316722 RepID=A0A3A8QFG8_9BACT|nr:hypothetical protein D7W81_13830 [Corallococcus aberystwythensis]
MTERRWLIVPKTCRTLALQMDCAGGHPECSAQVLHRPGQPPTDPERELLLSWLGGTRRDPKKPEHQASIAPGLAPLPPKWEEASDGDGEEDAPEPTRGAKTPPASFIVRAVAQPPPRWLAGPPVAQSLSWAESHVFADKEEDSIGAPEGFVSSGRFYSVHRGDCCVRADAVREAGTERLRFFSSPSRAIQKASYVVLELPKRHCAAWLAASEGGLQWLGMHGGRAWLKSPGALDPGFSLLAIDVKSGAAWHLDLDRTATFNPDAYRARAVTKAGLLIEPFDGEASGPRKTVPWALLERALRDPGAVGDSVLMMGACRRLRPIPP